MTLLYSFLIAAVSFTGTAYCDSRHLRKLIADDGVLTEAGKEALLQVHNDQRSATALGNTGTQPMAKNMIKLTWDQDIADTAQTWANNCKFKHDSSSYGENLYVAFSSADNVDNIAKLVSGVNAWYMEHTDYVYDGNTCNKVCGHYTQNVWANTKKVGCAYAANCGINPSWPYDVLLVCRYDPPGNYVGQLPYERATSTSEIASNCPSGYVGDSASGLCIKSVGVEYNYKGRCGPLFGGRSCDCSGYEKYCNTANGWCGTTDAHKNAQAGSEYDCRPGSQGRCGPLFGGRRCDCTTYEKYCNTANGWCGVTNAHKNAQAGDEYDCINN